MDAGDTFANDNLKLWLWGTPIANIADNAASAPLTNLYLSLHTANPGTNGDQTTNEISYTGYARKAVPRSSSGFAISGKVATLAALVAFDQMTGGAGGTATYMILGTASSGAGKIVARGAISPQLLITTGVTPELNTSSQITLG